MPKKNTKKSNKGKKNINSKNKTNKKSSTSNFNDQLKKMLMEQLISKLK